MGEITQNSYLCEVLSLKKFNKRIFLKKHTKIKINFLRLIYKNEKFSKHAEGFQG